MNSKYFSEPVGLQRIEVTDPFFKSEMELVRKEVIPYQWEILNDRVPEATPSYCMHNFRVAGRMMREKREQGAAYVEPVYTFRGFETLPEDPRNPDDEHFYGLVFQDSDFSKWIEAVGYSLIQHPDPELEKVADGAIDIVCAAQMENGYLDTYYIINGTDKIFTNLKDHHELYCFGHLTEGAVAYYEATGKDKLLNAVKRYADFIASYFGPEPEKCKGYPGHEIAEMALVRLYKVTGDEKYLNLASFFLDERGTRPYYFDKECPPKKDEAPKMRYQYYQSHQPVREQSEAVGHAVRAVYLYSGMADMARIKQDEALYAACKKLWKSIVDEKLYITGGIGGTHIGESFSFSYDLPNDTAYAETCASIGLVFFASRMARMEADAVYGDVMEQALYNGILSGMSTDGKKFFYVNPLEVKPEACEKDERKWHVKPVRQNWFGCACCPPNLARLISSVGTYAYTETEDTLYFHLYVGGKIRKQIADQEITVSLDSNFPWDGKVCATVCTKQPVNMTLAFRIPGWARSKFSVPSFEGKQVRVEKGYMYVSGLFYDGETLAMDFPMEVNAYDAHDKVSEDEGCVAIKRGPVVYCAEEKDNGADLHRVYVDLGKEIDTASDSELEKLSGTTPIILKAAGRRVSRNEGAAELGDSLYRPHTKAKWENIEVTLIPYYLWANRGEGEMRVFLKYVE